MKKWLWMLAGFGVAVVLVVAGMAIVTSVNANAVLPQIGDGPGGRHGGRGGMMGGGGMMGSTGDTDRGLLSDVMHTAMLSVFADRLATTPTDLQARLDAGESLYDIAEAAGVTQEEFVTLRDTARTQALVDAVSQGLITQEQADQMAARHTGGGMHSGRGGRMGFGGTCNCDCTGNTETETDN